MLILGCSAIFISVGWFLWALYSKVSIFETTEKAHLVSESIVTGEFPLSSNVLIQLDQMAIFEFENLPWPSYPKIQGKTIKIYPHHSKDTLMVQVQIDAKNNSMKPMTSGMAGRLVIKIGEVSPIHLMVKNLSEAIAYRE